MKLEDLLHEFWNRESDACPLEASEQEKQEKEFTEWVQDINFDLKDAARPLLKHLCENYHPHVTAIVTPVSVELFEGIKSETEIYDYLID